jgi:TATA-binding protein-associated factor Taf7
MLVIPASGSAGANSPSAVQAELKRFRAIHAEYKEQLECFEDDKPFVPRLTAKNKEKRTETKPLKGTKRKNSRGGKRGSPKRRRSESVDRDGDEDDKMDDSDSDLFKSDSDRSDVDSDEEDKDDSDNDSDEEQDSDREKNSDRENSDHEDSDHEDSDREDSNIDVDEIEEEVTAETIKHNIAEAKKPMDDARQRLNGARKLKKEALDHLATLKKKATTAQKVRCSTFFLYPPLSLSLHRTRMRSAL